MPDERTAAPDETALRVALWRALHTQIDPPPHVLEDVIGLLLAAPNDDWHQRPDMDAKATSRARASIVARARFIEDLVIEQVDRGVGQYLILGAGLDTFVQRRPEIATRLRTFEVDQPSVQAWKQKRLIEAGFGIPEYLRLVPVDFETGWSWWEKLAPVGFDSDRPTVAASSGVTMYLSKDAVMTTLRRAAALVRGSTLAMTFMLPLEFVDSEERAQRQAAEQGAQAAGTPFISFFSPTEMLALAREAGFREVQHVSAIDLAERYFAGRTDGLRPSSAEQFLVART
jgi:methyltransferase (TIGR00027 family)